MTKPADLKNPGEAPDYIREQQQRREGHFALKGLRGSTRESARKGCELQIIGAGCCVNDLLRTMRRHGHEMNEAQLERIESTNRLLAAVTSYRVRIQEPEEHAA